MRGLRHSSERRNLPHVTAVRAKAVPSQVAVDVLRAEMNVRRVHAVLKQLRERLDALGVMCLFPPVVVNW